MNILKREFKTFLFILLATGISLVFLTKQNDYINNRVFSAMPNFSTPTPIIFIPNSIETTIMDSPDGTKTLTMEKQLIKDYVKYSFFTSSKSETSRSNIFYKQEILSRNFSIPYNTWSPDNTYFFLKESTPIFNNYFVFNSSGNYFPDNSQYLDIQILFSQKVNGYTIEDVTGWAAPNLLFVNTKAIQGEKKATFWFDVTSRSFIQLGTYFF